MGSLFEIVLNKYKYSSKRTTTAIKNIAGAFIVKGCSVFIQFLLIPVTIGYVSSELYGVWLSLSTLMGWASLLDLGFGNGVRNKISENVALGNWEQARKYISTGYAFFTMLFVPVSFILYFLCGLVNWPYLLNVNPEYQSDLVIVTRIIAIFFCLTSIVRLQSTTYLALQKNAVSAMIEMFGQLLILILVIILTKTTEGSLVYLAIVIGGSPFVVQTFSGILLFGKYQKQLRPSFSTINFKLIKDVLGLGINFFFVTSSTVVLFYTMNLLMSHISGPEFVTEYNVVYKYISLPLIISTIVISPYWSAYTDAYALRDYGWMKSSYVRLNRMIYFAIVGVTLLSLFSPIFFNIWLGDKVQIHTSMLIAVSIYVLIMVYNQLNATLTFALGKLRLHTILALLGTIGSIPLSLILGKSYGAIGVVYSVGFFSLLPAILLRIQVLKLINGNASGIWNS